jgi:dsRNA-specific ribonuclease
VVNETCLAKIARKMNLGAFIKLGKGEIKSEGHEKN